LTFICNCYRVEQPKTASALQRVEGGTVRRQTVVGQFNNPAYTKETVNSDDLTFNNPGFVEAPAITKLEGVTTPVEKSAITRLSSEEIDRKQNVNSESV